MLFSRDIPGFIHRLSDIFTGCYFHTIKISKVLFSHYENIKSVIFSVKITSRHVYCVKDLKETILKKLSPNCAQLLYRGFNLKCF